METRGFYGFELHWYDNNNFVIGEGIKKIWKLNLFFENQMTIFYDEIL